MRTIFSKEHYEAYEPVELTFYTRELGRFVIAGSFQDVEPSYRQALRAS